MIKEGLEAMYGLRPLKRERPQFGQGEWYYVDPRGANRFAEMEEIEVESENSPNPYAEEIQNYLYENKRDVYDLLYGEELPPKYKIKEEEKEDTHNSQYQITMPPQEQYQLTMPTTEWEQDNYDLWDKVQNWANNFAQGTQAATVGYASGASLGNFDEAMGTATAAITFNPDNYTLGRDAVRQLQNELSNKHPYLYGGAEFVGAMQTPMHIVDDKTFRKRAFNALTDTLNSSIGYAQNWDDFLTNLAVNGVANGIGLSVGYLPGGRALGVVGKKALTQGVNYITNKLKNMYYDDKEE